MSEPVQQPTTASRTDLALRIFAATLGTLPVVLLTSASLARFLPLTEDARFTIGFTLAIPLWVTAMCFGFLARSGLRAWGVCLGACVVLSALVYGVPL